MQTSMILEACHLIVGSPSVQANPPGSRHRWTSLTAMWSPFPFRYSHMRGGCEAAMKRHRARTSRSG